MSRVFDASRVIQHGSEIRMPHPVYLNLVEIIDGSSKTIDRLKLELEVEKRNALFYRDELDRAHGLMLDNHKPSSPFWEDPFFWVAFFAAALILSFF